MKELRRVVITLIALAIVAGCSYTGQSPRTVTADSAESNIEFTYFEKDGHQWIHYNGKDVWPGIVHDPNCKCGR